MIDDDRSVDVTLKPHSLTTLKYDSDYEPDENIDEALPDKAVKPIAATASSYEKIQFIIIRLLQPLMII